jgi:hypothetical protein
VIHFNDGRELTPNTFEEDRLDRRLAGVHMKDQVDIAQDIAVGVDRGAWDNFVAVARSLVVVARIGYHRISRHPYSTDHRRNVAKALWNRRQNDRICKRGNSSSRK